MGIRARYGFLIAGIATTLALALFVPAGAAEHTLEWDPPIETEHAVPRGIAHGPAGYVSIDPHPLDDVGSPLQSTMFFSADGFNWEETTTITTARLSGVTPGGPGFVAVGSRRISGDLLGPAVWVSTDGRSWTEVTGVPAPSSAATAPLLATADLIPFIGSWMTDVAFDGDLLVAVGEVVGSPGAVWTSLDGTIWSLVAGTPFGEDNTRPEWIAAGAPGWMVVTREHIEGDAPGPMFTWWSSDGSTWTRAEDDGSFGAGTGFGPFVHGLLGFGDGFVMVGMHDLDPVAWVSADGRSWSAPYTLPTRPETGSSFVHDAATDGELIVVVGDDVIFDPGLGPATSDASIWVSATGTEWAQVEPESLRDDITTHSIDAEAVSPVAGWWVVHGDAAEVDEPAIPIAWVGKPTGAGTFVDVPPEHLFHGDVEWLAANGITKGCNPPFNTRFCPADTVTREQAAALLVRAFGYTDDGGGDHFTDDNGSIFEPDIDKLATAGVTKGCNPPINDNFCPSQPVNRAELAAFLHRGFG